MFQSLSHDIILPMPENHGDDENEQTNIRGGQLLGCIFAVFAVGAIFLFLFVFMSSC
jgi:hypothetical protein